MTCHQVMVYQPLVLTAPLRRTEMFESASTASLTGPRRWCSAAERGSWSGTNMQLDMMTMVALSILAHIEAGGIPSNTSFIPQKPCCFCPSKKSYPIVLGSDPHVPLQDRYLRSFRSVDVAMKVVFASMKRRNRCGNGIKTCSKRGGVASVYASSSS